MDTRRDRALDGIIERHGRHIRRVVESIHSDPNTVDDVMQQTWLALLQSGGLDIRRVRPWLARVARRRAIDVVRKEVSRRDVEARIELEDRPTNPALPANADERGALSRRIDRAVSALPERYRTVLRLRFYDELNASQVAERLELPLETVRTRVRRGLILLRDSLAAKGRPSRSRVGGFGAWLRLWRSWRTLLRAGRWGGAVVAPMVVSAFLLPLDRDDPRPVSERIARTAASPTTAGLPVTTAQERRVVDAAFPPVDVLSDELIGTVRGPLGGPLAQAVVMLWSGRPSAVRDAVSLGRTESDEYGRFVLPRPQGACHVTVDVPRLSPAELVLVPPLCDGSVGAIEVRMVEPVSLSGRVWTPEGQPVWGADVSSFRRIAASHLRRDPDANVTYLAMTPERATTDRGGQFVLSGLAPGAYPLFIDHPDYLPHARTIALDSPAIVDVIVERGERMEVCVVDSHGRAVTGADVRLETLRKLEPRRCGLVQERRTNTKGHALFGRIAPDAHVFVRVASESRAPFVLGPLDWQPSLTLRLPDSRTLAGQILDSGGVGVAGVPVLARSLRVEPQSGAVVREASARYRTVAEATSSPDGTFRFASLPAEPLELVFQDSLQSAACVRRVGAREHSVTLRATGVGGAMLSGRISNDLGPWLVDGSASPGVAALSGAGNRFVLVDVSKDGRYQLSADPNDFVVLCFYGPGVTPRMLSVEPEPGRVALDAKLTPSRPVELTAYGHEGEPIPRGALVFRYPNGDPVLATCRDDSYSNLHWLRGGVLEVDLPCAPIEVTLLAPGTLDRVTLPLHLRLKDGERERVELRFDSPQGFSQSSSRLRDAVAPGTAELEGTFSIGFEQVVLSFDGDHPTNFWRQPIFRAGRLVDEAPAGSPKPERSAEQPKPRVRAAF